MKKLLDLLEQKVQWIVLGLGVLWVLYMAWSFLIQPPVKVTANGQEVSPGEVDEQVGNKLIQDYEALKVRKVPTAMIRFNDEWHGTSSRPSNYLRTQLYLRSWFEKYATKDDKVAVQ